MVKKNSHIEIVKTHFDNRHQQWRNLYHNFRSAHHIVLLNRKNISLAFLCKYLKPGSRILDAGCGAGVAAMDVVQKGFFVYGIDISKKMIELCEQSFSQRDIHKSRYFFEACNVIDVDFSKSPFDGILALGFLEYQKNEHIALKKFQKALRPGGILVCAGPIKFSITSFFGLGRLLRNIHARIREQKQISINRYSLSRFKMLLESSGFTMIDYKRHGYADFTVFNKLIGLRLGLFIHQALTKLSTFLPVDSLANDIIVVAKKNE